MNALGLVEVKGLLNAITIADIGLKAANVSLITIEQVKGGLVTVILSGDVGAVKAAIDSIDLMYSSDILLSKLVIPNPASGIEKLYKDRSTIKKKPDNPVISKKDVIVDVENEHEETDDKSDSANKVTHKIEIDTSKVEEQESKHERKNIDKILNNSIDVEDETNKIEILEINDDKKTTKKTKRK